jgi:hypothetical protein
VKDERRIVVTGPVNPTAFEFDFEFVVERE